MPHFTMSPLNFGAIPCSLTFPNHNEASSSPIYSYDASFDMADIQADPLGSEYTPTQYPDEREYIAINESPGIDKGRVNYRPASASFASQSAPHQYPSTTPVKRRRADLQHCLPAVAPDQNSSVNTHLEIELEKARPTASLNLPSVVFPDSSLPFVVDEPLLRSLQGVWDSRYKILIAPKDLTEHRVKDWLNNIANKLNSVTAINPIRAWSLNVSNSPANVSCGSGVMLISNPIDPQDWSRVKAVAEVSLHPELHTALKKTINYKSYRIFTSQPTRRFVPFLAICAKTIHFIIADREGQTISEISYRQQGEYHALTFLRIIVALMFANDETIGYDPTVTTLPSGRIQNIFAGGELYKVNTAVYVVRCVVGRSTRVWSAFHVEHGWVVVKDGWIQEAQAKAEEGHLKTLQGIPGIPTLIWGGTVQIHRPEDHLQFIDDNTAWIRHGFFAGDTYRIHRRLVLRPVGQKLSSFTSLVELVTALRDIAVAHKACCERGILHRDISFNNILLVRYENDSAEKKRRGMLIDFDYAASVSQKLKIGQRTGTPPFMAIALLLNGAVENVHYAKYDLESLMYVAFYCATMLKGPGDNWRVEADLKGQSIPMQEWFSHRLNSSFGQMARTKVGHMALFEQSIINRMDPYFSPIFPGFRSLQVAVFPNNDSYCNSPIDHDAMIHVFDDILKDLPEDAGL